jgi:hypothetical protein
VWLRPVWEKKSAETATRVEVAVQSLKFEGRNITIKSIRERILTLNGVSISPNTIKRNDRAYQAYVNNRQGGSLERARDPSLMELMDETAADDRPSLRAKAARLGRERKDALIARVIRLERAALSQRKLETALRDELLVVSLKAKRSEASTS